MLLRYFNCKEIKGGEVSSINSFNVINNPLDSTRSSESIRSLLAHAVGASLRRALQAAEINDENNEPGTDRRQQPSD
jgi:hypothetical protein